MNPTKNVVNSDVPEGKVVPALVVTFNYMLHIVTQ